MANHETEPDEATLEAEREDALQAHTADRPPTDEESAAAERSAETFAGDREEVAAEYEKLADIGAHVKGEGEID